MANGQQSRFAQSKEKQKKRYNSNKNSNKENDFLLIVGFVFTILPLLVHAKKYMVYLDSYEWFSALDSSLDIFLYYKQWVFTLCMFSMVVCIAASFFNGKRQFKFQKIFIPLFIYGGLALLSTLISSNRNFGFSGIYEQFESVFCLLGYVVIVYYLYLYIQNEKDVHFLINALAIGALVIGLIGMFQGFKLDFMRTGFGKSLMASNDLSTDGMQFQFPLGRAFVTLYNPNYVGVYATMVIPVFAVLSAYAKNWKERVLYIAVTVSSIFSMFAAQFKAGIISLLLVGIVSLFFVRKYILKRWYIVVCVVVALVGLFAIVDEKNDHNYSNSIRTALTVTKSIPYALTGMETQKDGITFDYLGEHYTFTVDTAADEAGTQTYSNFKLVKKDGTEVKCVWGEDGVLRFEDPNLANMYVANTTIDFLEKNSEDGQLYNVSVAGLDFVIDGVEWKVAKYGDVFKYLNFYGKASSMKNAPTMLLGNYDELASKRGFMWARTLPLLKKYIVFGSGADTFTLVYPQNDYVAMKNAGYEGNIISKPHCMYLQVAVQTGLVSLLAMLVFLGMYLVQSICLYGKSLPKSQLGCTGLAILLGVIGYLVSCISNDSSITVAPVFWGLIGLGITVNCLVKEEMDR